MNNYRGGWSSEGCVYDGTVNGHEVCLCDHLTNFAVLMVVSFIFHIFLMLHPVHIST